MCSLAKVEKRETFHAMGFQVQVWNIADVSLLASSTPAQVWNEVNANLIKQLKHSAYTSNKVAD